MLQPSRSLFCKAFAPFLRLHTFSQLMLLKSNNVGQLVLSCCIVHTMLCYQLITKVNNHSSYWPCCWATDKINLHAPEQAVNSLVINSLNGNETFSELNYYFVGHWMLCCDWRKDRRLHSDVSRRPGNYVHFMAALFRIWWGSVSIANANAT